MTAGSRSYRRSSRRLRALPPVSEEDPAARLLGSEDSEEEYDADNEVIGEVYANPAFEASEEVPETAISEVVVLLHRLSTRMDRFESAVTQQTPDLRARPPAPSGPADPVRKRPDAPALLGRRRVSPNSFVDHTALRHRIAAGYEAQAPSALAPLEPHVYLFNDEVSRSLAGTRFQAKLTEYRLTCTNGFFLSCANQALLEVVEALGSDVPDSVRCRLTEIYNSHAAIENVMRDRKTFLATQNDPSATQAMRAFSDTILRNRFEADLAAYGASSSVVETYDTFTDQVAKSRIWATAKAEAMREIESGKPRLNPNPDKAPNPNPNAGRGKPGKGKDREKGKGADAEKADGG